MRHTVVCLLSLKFYVYIFVALAKSGVVTLLSEIPRYRNDHCYYYSKLPEAKSSSHEQTISICWRQKQ